MQTETPAHDPHHPGDPYLKFQFSDRARQFHASKFGMWLFLSTEIMFFAALFCSYAFYRNQYPDAFRLASEHLNRHFGLYETIDLITSSFFMALAIHYIRQGKRAATVVCLFLTVAMAFGFLGMHSFEYYTEYTEKLLPGRFFHPEASFGLPAESSMFYTCYFFLTVVHSVHVIIGIGLLSWVTFHVSKGRFNGNYNTPVELVGLYWHIVDLIWIFLFPLLYLITK